MSPNLTRFDGYLARFDPNTASRAPPSTEPVAGDADSITAATSSFSSRGSSVTTEVGTPVPSTGVDTIRSAAPPRPNSHPTPNRTETNAPARLGSTFGATHSTKPDRSDALARTGAIVPKAHASDMELAFEEPVATSTATPPAAVAASGSTPRTVSSALYRYAASASPAGTPTGPSRSVAPSSPATSPPGVSHATSADDTGAACPASSPTAHPTSPPSLACLDVTNVTEPP
mmetsp:Transcript_13758/g.60066  ORF Transcript_13758/g.60066 Transcript_13758/m.60066 type:complete len:231 (+) Transcript_13758:4245-4937(+)